MFKNLFKTGTLIHLFFYADTFLLADETAHAGVTQSSKLQQNLMTLLSGFFEVVAKIDPSILISASFSFILFIFFSIILYQISRILGRLQEKIKGSSFFPIKFRNLILLDETTIQGSLYRTTHIFRLLLAPIIFISWWSLTLLFFPELRNHFLLNLLRSLFFTVLTGFLAWWTLQAVNHFFLFLQKNIDNWKGTLIRPVRISSAELISEESLTVILKNSISIIRYFILLLLAYLFLPLVFSFFSVTQKWATLLLGYVVRPIHLMTSAVIGYLPNLFFILVTILIVYYVISFTKIIFLAIGENRIRLEGFRKEWADPTYKISRFLIIVFTLIVVFPYLPGSESDAFKGVSIFIGILFSLGSSSAIANAVAGIILTYMFPFRVGDRVKIGDASGDVIEMTLLVTRIKTVKNVVITIPNSMVMGSQIVNYSSDSIREPLILNTTVTLGYDVPWRKVHRVLIESALNTEGILDQPAPFVLQTALGDFSISYELNACTDNPHAMSKILSDLHASVLDGCNQAGIEILSPTYQANRDGSESTLIDPAKSESD